MSDARVRKLVANLGMWVGPSMLRTSYMGSETPDQPCNLPTALWLGDKYIAQLFSNS